ncbi:hypothetical protein RN001_000298 [Aquatica leii]|uniref:Uncharacterized protein n=1 Tax=Aquatica leii TaxID=1421715 RepID=A0AAN7SJ41_9COLE|nr:hypothetical protein RN001_000298 [Aquatica leii]
MCKGCQYCLEACYWHLIEKRFCYDESIALYEEPGRKEEKYPNVFENIAFYDQVALIAGRSIVTIDALPKEPKPIAHQPRPTIRWWEDDVVEQNKENEYKCSEVKRTASILKASNKDISVITVEEEPPKIDQPVSDKPEPQNMNLLQVEPVKLRKKSLAERRASRSLTLNIDRTLELPIIRQVSMPKFYIDTPEANQMDPNYFKEPSSVLTSPVIKDPSDLYDLRSIVQLEKDNRNNLQSSSVVPVHKQQVPSSAHSRLSLIKEKLNTTKLKKQASTSNLPHSIQHI